jgi:putative nucleotidyltransferase with HDIG domain
MIAGIRFKISIIIFLLVAFVTVASSVIVINVMDRFILDALLKKGMSIGKSASSVAGYHMLSGDRLALDNLSVKLKENEDDVLYVAAVDNSGKIWAHSSVSMAGEEFTPAAGVALSPVEDGATVVRAEGGASYEFRIPVMFMEMKVGDIFLGIGNDSLAASQLDARNKIIMAAVAVMLLGTLGAYFLSSIFIQPIRRLSVGVTRLSSDDYKEDIEVSSHDELGELTERFNEMAHLITDQKSQLKQSNREIEESYIATIKLISTVIDARDNYTLGHSARVSNLSLMVGRSISLSEEELHDLEVAAMFHDVGKIRTPDSILKKSEPLTEEEFFEMMRHTTDGANILRVVDSLHRYIPPVLYHHEWYNGKGYPHGLKEEEIPVLASIISVTDAFDAMTSSRPYRSAMPKEAALEQLTSYRGVQFDPRVLDPFLEILEDYDVLSSSVDIFA